MNKILLGILLLVGSLFAQLQWNAEEYNDGPSFTIDRGDTLTQYLDRTTKSILYSISNAAGYIFGTGWDTTANKEYLLSLAIGMHYDGVKDARVVEVLGLFFKNSTVGNVGNVIAKVCWVNENIVPTDTLGKAILPVSSLSIEQDQFTSFKMKDPLNTEGKPFMIILEFQDDLSTILVTDDTVGVVANDTKTNDGKGENRARMWQHRTGNWVPVSKVFTGLDCDAMLLPVIDNVTKNTKPVSVKGLTLNEAYISTNSGEINIKYNLSTSQNVSLRIFTLAGKNIVKTDSEFKTSGLHKLSVPLNEVSSGQYYYTITTNETSLTGKIFLCK